MHPMVTDAVVEAVVRDRREEARRWREAAGHAPPRRAVALAGLGRALLAAVRDGRAAAATPHPAAAAPADPPRPPASLAPGAPVAEGDRLWPAP